ncbi:MAG: hypothetical protein WD025_03995, partial [Bacteriovoracaceae bacterium]
MKLSILIYTLFMTFSCASNEFTLLHYNIRELDSKKIGEQDLQIKKTAQILRNFQFDIFSLNEIQYDLPGVPNRNYSSKGENLDKLKGLLGVPASWSSSFYPANTGMNAQKNGRGEYETDPAAPGARDLADPVNFGTLPGQYSTGAIYKFPKTKETVFNKIKWKEFNPNIDLDQFALPSGEPLPENIELFDKNFSDIELNINGETVHLVLLHTVPSFHFGNLKSPNYARNRDQLRFLEWYLTGKTDIK